VLDCIQIDSSSEEDEEEQVLNQPMEVEKAPEEDKLDMVAFDLFPDVTKAKLCHITQAPVNFKVNFTAKTKVCLLGIELLSRDFASTKWSKRY
jgi:hypothetical protein